MRVALLLFGVAGAGIAVAQLPKDDQSARVELEEQLKRDASDIALVRKLMFEMNSPLEGAECRLSYVITTARSKWNQLDTLVTSVDYVASANALHLESPDAVVLRDSAVMATVLPPQRMIILANVLPEEQRRAEEGSIQFLRDSLFDHVRVAGRSVGTPDDSTTLETINMTTDGLVLGGHALTALAIQFDRSRGRLIAVRAEFARSEIQFAHIVYGVRKCSAEPATRAPILQGIVDGGGRPIGRFEGFAVVDQRGPVAP